jgi:hypothetical protein
VYDAAESVQGIGTRGTACGTSCGANGVEFGRRHARGLTGGGARSGIGHRSAKNRDPKIWVIYQGGSSGCQRIESTVEVECRFRSVSTRACVVSAEECVYDLDDVFYEFCTCYLAAFAQQKLKRVLHGHHGGTSCFFFVPFWFCRTRYKL